MRTKIISSSLLFVTILVFSLFVVTTKPLSAQTLLDTGASSAIGNTIDSGPAINPNTLRERVRQNIEQRTENIRENQEIRNKIIENRQTFGSTTNPLKTPFKNSPNPMLIKEKENNNKSLAFRIFQEKRANTIKQFNVALENLRSLRNRLNARIEKEVKNGKDMSKAVEALKIADNKIILARESVKALASYTPSTTTDMVRSNSTSTLNRATLVNLDPARKLIEDARNKIKDAHEALVITTTEVAKASGNKTGKDLPKPPRMASTTPTMSTSSNITN